MVSIKVAPVTWEGTPEAVEDMRGHLFTGHGRSCGVLLLKYR